MPYVTARSLLGDGPSAPAAIVNSAATAAFYQAGFGVALPAQTLFWFSAPASFAAAWIPASSVVAGGLARWQSPFFYPCRSYTTAPPRIVRSARTPISSDGSSAKMSRDSTATSASWPGTSRPRTPSAN